jgi:hypothetical protein
MADNASALAEVRRVEPAFWQKPIAAFAHDSLGESTLRASPSCARHGAADRQRLGWIATAPGPSQIARRQLTARHQDRAVAKQRARQGWPSIDSRRVA